VTLHSADGMLPAAGCNRRWSWNVTMQPIRKHQIALCQPALKRAQKQNHKP
jgi:hypothetical protein